MSQDSSKGTVLVVDDEASIRLLLTKLLEDRGFAVLTASGGREGLALAREHEPDLIILDIMMEDMDGTEVGSTLREAPRTAGIPIIYLTGLLAESETGQRKGQGGDVIVAKPFDVRALMDLVEESL